MPKVLVRRVGSAVLPTPPADQHADAFRAVLLGPSRRLVRRGPQGRLEREQVDLGRSRSTP